MSSRIVHIIPHLLTMIIGGTLCFLCNWMFGVIYIGASIIGLFWFWKAICTNCRGYGSPHCPSGYGIISSRIFKRSPDPDFKRAFKRNIISVALQWFIPPGVGIYCLVTDPDLLIGILLGIFILVAFVVLPLVSRSGGCRKCPQAGDCPWKKV